MEKEGQAYDLSLFEDKVVRKEPLRVVSNPRIRQAKRRSAMHTAEVLLVSAVLVAMMVAVLKNQAELTTLADNVDDLNTALVEEKSVYDDLNYQLTNDANLSRIEQYVSQQLGMVKIDHSQMNYLELSDENKVEAAESGVQRCWDNLVGRFRSLLEYFGW